MRRGSVSVDVELVEADSVRAVVGPVFPEEDADWATAVWVEKNAANKTPAQTPKREVMAWQEMPKRAELLVNINVIYQKQGRCQEKK